MSTGTTITITAMDITGTSTADPAAALKLQAWLSPAFPVGSFAYSHGLERAQEAGWIVDAAGLAAWLADLVEHGSWRNDAIMCACAWRAAASGDLAGIAGLALAFASAAERRLETVQQGNAFVVAIRAAWPTPAIERLKQLVPGDVAYPVALGVAAAGHDIGLPALLEAFGTGFVSNLVSAAIRLGIIGQTDGQRTLALLLPMVVATARNLRDATLDDIGGAALRSDLAALQHETQYTRLFRS